MEEELIEKYILGQYHRDVINIKKILQLTCNEMSRVGINPNFEKRGAEIYKAKGFDLIELYFKTVGTEELIQDKQQLMNDLSNISSESYL